ncbi:Nuclear factor related to kappa-B-binding protein [Nymphaea thermarum]|nr:Nuclear factor related to kappa-B-binding protein [Nymphaea thermarum]
MAAGQQKRRLNAVNLASCNIPEQHRGKKRKDLDLSPSILSFNPHISLEWKGKQKRAVARKDQVAISWRDLSPFIDGGQQSYSHARLADVFTVPHEIFELDNLQGLLSCQAWKMCLSASERKLLSQFLPKGIDVDQLLQSLFDGENFHFGNSFLEWGSLLCSGNLHPDAVIQRELIFKDNRKGYYSELQKYHNVMLEELQILKETWINSRDPANFQKLLRCRRNNTEYNISSHADESAPLSLRENVGVTTDSGSSIGDDINDIWEERQEDSQERLTKPKVRRGVSISINKNVDNNLEEDDKEIIRSQQIVKKLKLTSGSVKFKSLNRVLGDTKKLEDQPCGALEEDGDKKLHNHWLQIACTDIMAAFASHVERQSQISELKALLGQEIADKRRLVITQDGEKESGSSKQEEQDNASEDEDSDVAIENYEEDESSPSTGDNQALEHVPSFNSREEPDTASEEMEEDVNNSNDIGIEKNEAVSPPTLRQSLVRIPSLNGHEHELVFEETVEDVNKTDEMMLESCERDAAESSVMCMTTDQRTEEEPCTAPGMSKFLEDAESAEDMVHAGGSTEDVWSTVNMAGGTYYDEGHDYSTVNKLRIRNQTVEEQPARMINLEEDILRDGDEDAGLCGPDDNVGSAVQANNGPSFFDTYEDVGPGQIISKPVLLKAQQSYSGHHVGEMKQQELPFTMGAGNSSDGFHFSQHLHEQRQQLLDERQAGEKELHPLHLMQNMYGYADKQPTRQVFTPTTNSIDWETDSARVLPFQPSAAGEMLDHHWGSYGGRTHSNWSALDVPLSSQGHCPGDGTAADGSLFGFVRQLNGFARSPYDTVGSHQYVGPSAYAGGAAPQGDEMQCQGHSAQFAYLNQQYGYMHPHQDATRHRPNGSMAWMNMPLAAGVNAEMMHQSSIMHDSLGKPFLGSWNQ